MLKQTCIHQDYIRASEVQRATSALIDVEESDDIEVEVDINNRGDIEIELETDEDNSSEEITAMSDATAVDNIPADTLDSNGASYVPHVIGTIESSTGNMEGEGDVQSSTSDEEDDVPIEIDVHTKSAEEIQNVSELCISLSACQLGTTLSLSKQKVCCAPVSRIPERSRWRAEPLWPQLCEINEHNIQKGLFALASINSPDARLCGVSGMGWELEGGTVELGTNGGIIFDSACDNVVVNGVIFRGVVSLPSLSSHSVLLTHSTCVSSPANVLFRILIQLQ